jgi:hypothetical protein
MTERQHDIVQRWCCNNTVEFSGSNDIQQRMKQGFIPSTDDKEWTPGSVTEQKYILCFGNNVGDFWIKHLLKDRTAEFPPPEVKFQPSNTILREDLQQQECDQYLVLLYNNRGKFPEWVEGDNMV